MLSQDKFPDAGDSMLDISKLERPAFESLEARALRPLAFPGAAGWAAPLDVAAVAKWLQGDADERGAGLRAGAGVAILNFLRAGYEERYQAYVLAHVYDSVRNDGGVVDATMAELDLLNVCDVLAACFSEEGEFKRTLEQAGADMPQSARSAQDSQGGAPAPPAEAPDTEVRVTVDAAEEAEWAKRYETMRSLASEAEKSSMLVRDRALTRAGSCINPTKLGDVAAYVLTTCAYRDSIARTTEEQGASLACLRAVFRLLLAPSVSEQGRLQALLNLSKPAFYRELALASAVYVGLVKEHLQDRGLHTRLYKASHVLWLWSMSEAGVALCLEQGLVALCCEVVKKVKMEKALRVSLRALANFLRAPSCADALVAADLRGALEALPYERWRDAGVYDLLKECAALLATLIANYGNFDRYVEELATGRLRWNVLHDAAFWQKHALRFEHDGFSAVHGLAALLQSSEDPTTLAVACHDLGEFARLYPGGKQVCLDLGVKPLVSRLVAHASNDVAAQALLCVQKLILNNWTIANQAMSHENNPVESEA